MAKDISYAGMIRNQRALGVGQSSSHEDVVESEVLGKDELYSKLDNYIRDKAGLIKSVKGLVEDGRDENSPIVGVSRRFTESLFQIRKNDPELLGELFAYSRAQIKAEAQARTDAIEAAKRDKRPLPLGPEAGKGSFRRNPKSDFPSASR